MVRTLPALILMGTILFFGLNSSAYAAESKKICKNITTKGKTTEKCRTVKIHKKLDGKKVPEKAKKK